MPKRSGRGSKVTSKKECKNIPSISKLTIENEIKKHILLLVMITKLHNLYLNAVENANNSGREQENVLLHERTFRYNRIFYNVSNFIKKCK